jgi:hypothetical protein
VEFHHSYVTETPLLWAFCDSRYLFSFTENWVFIVTSLGESSPEVGHIDLIPMDHQLSFFVASWSKRYICAAPRSDSCLIICVTDPLNPTCDAAFFDDRLILSLSANEDEDAFAALAIDSASQKELVEFDGLTREIVSIKAVPADVMQLISPSEASDRYFPSKH